ncbi:hypothetical protein ES705_43797 [subsurface metagenome]
MTTSIPDRSRGVERFAGMTGLLISFLVVTAIFTGLDINPEFAVIHEDLAYLGENLFRLRIDNLVWFINSILIIIFGPLILMSFLSQGRSSAYLAAFLICTTGIIYLIFAVNGFNLIYLIRDYLGAEGSETELLASLSYHILITKTNLQLTAYSLAGISSVIVGLMIVRSGSIPRFIGWVAITGGMIYGCTGWINAESVLFTLGRLLFVLSLILLGAVLLLRGKKKQKDILS